MLKLITIGHLGNDATIKEWSGQTYAAFSVANTESYTDGQGVKHETTEWISCLKRVKDGSSALVPLLKKGTKVYVEGQLSKKMFEKNGQMTCGLNCNVSHLELLSPKQADSQAQQGPLKAEPIPTTTEPLPSASAGGDDLPF